MSKTVVHTHRNVLFDIGRQTRDNAIGQQDRFDLLFSPSFSAFLSPVFGALLTGASVHCFDLKSRPVEQLRDWLEAKGITVSTQSVSGFRRLAGVLPPGRSFPALRMLSLGAEPLLLNDINLFRARFSEKATLQNALATTETRTIAQIFYRASDALPDEVSVGFPVEGKHLRLLDEGGSTVAGEGIGEIVVEGGFISPGSWAELRHSPGGRLPPGWRAVCRTGDLARRRPDGSLIFLGRKDQQIKLRGHRIDLSEIEGALLGFPAIADAAVFLRAADPPVGEHLAALLVLRPGTADPLPNLRASLAEILPDYMLPSVWMAVAALPVTETGKLDRKGLAPLFQRLRAENPGQPARAGAASDEFDDDPLMDAWRRALAPATVGPDDDFFARGGDSLNAAEMMAEIERIIGRRIPIGTLLRFPTFRTFRRSLSGLGCDAPHRPAPTLLQPGTGGPPIYLLPPWQGTALIFRDLAGCPGGRCPTWCLDAREAPPLGLAAASIEEIAARYTDALRAIHPEGGIAVGGYSMGGYIAWEAARQLAALGLPPARVFLLDCSRMNSARASGDLALTEKCKSYRGRLGYLLRHALRPGRLGRWSKLNRTASRIHWWLHGRWQEHAVVSGRPYQDARYRRNIALGKRYGVLPYGGPVTLVRAGEPPGDWESFFLWDLGWSSYCPGGLKIVDISADHVGLIRKPKVMLLSRALQDAMDS